MLSFLLVVHQCVQFENRLHLQNHPMSQRYWRAQQKKRRRRKRKMMKVRIQRKGEQERQEEYAEKERTTLMIQH